ncbi:hypothetical protein MRX96_021093 [Rhipicephalus microplus]
MNRRAAQTYAILSYTATSVSWAGARKSHVCRRPLRKHLDNRAPRYWVSLRCCWSVDDIRITRLNGVSFFDRICCASKLYDATFSALRVRWALTNLDTTPCPDRKATNSEVRVVSAPHDLLLRRSLVAYAGKISEGSRNSAGRVVVVS